MKFCVLIRFLKISFDSVVQLETYMTEYHSRERWIFILQIINILSFIILLLYEIFSSVVLEIIHMLTLIILLHIYHMLLFKFYDIFGTLIISLNKQKHRGGKDDIY
jgi:hypothetical protein